MARLRAFSWGLEAFWAPRVLAYLEGRSHPRDSLAPRIAFVAVHDGAIVGLVAGHRTRRHGCDGELQWIDVEPARRGTGTAAALVRELAGWFRTQGAARVCIDVDPANERARRFYARMGARPLDEHWWVWDDLPSTVR